MIRKIDHVPWVDGAQFNENRNRMPADEVLKYAGKHVAWNREGTQILASGDDLESALANLAAVGLQPDEVVWSWIDPVDESAQP